MSDNPFVCWGKCTRLGQEYLELTDKAVVVTYEGIVRREKPYSRKEWTALWLKGEPWVEEWLKKVRRSLGVRA